MKKFLATLAAVLLGASLIFAVPAAAEEAADLPPIVEEDVAPEIVPTPAPEAPGAETPAPAPEEIPEDGAEADEMTTSELLAEWLSDYAAEILSAASVIVGGIVALLFKKGLLPFVSKALSAVADSSKKLSDQNAAGLAEYGIKVEDVRLNCEKMASKVDQLEAKLSASADKNAAVLKCTTEMIGTLLLNLKLTVDQRALVEDAMAEVKAKLGGGDAE